MIEIHTGLCYNQGEKTDRGEYSGWEGKMKRFRVLFSRLVLIGLMLLIQIAWLSYVLLKLSEYSDIINWFLQGLSVIAVLYIVQKRENPAYKLAWAIPILLFPLFGGMMYLMFGNKQPISRLRKKLEKEYRRSQNVLTQDGHVPGQMEEWDKTYQRQAQYVFSNSGYPVYRNSQARYFSSGEACFQAMLQELSGAVHYIFIEYFIIETGTMWEQILNILREKVSQGVKVYLIYDDVGCIQKLPSGYAKKMEAEGIRCIAFNKYIPVFSFAMNHRDHRKIMAIDGHTVFTGGLNLADEYINVKERFGYWKDAGVMIRGEAAWSFTVMFLQMWKAIRPMKERYEDFLPREIPESLSSDGFVQPYSDSPLDQENLAENIYMNIIQSAKEYVYIFTPYLVIDNEMTTALTTAAKKGVDVRIGMPGIPDKKMIFLLSKSYYRELLEAGVKIYEYTPGFLHSKCFVSDDAVATVGSCNLDYRSLFLHFENGTVLYHNAAVSDIKKDMKQTFAESRLVRLEDCRQGRAVSLVQAVLRCFAPAL